MIRPSINASTLADTTGRSNSALELLTMAILAQQQRGLSTFWKSKYEEIGELETIRNSVRWGKKERGGHVELEDDYNSAEDRVG